MSRGVPSPPFPKGGPGGDLKKSKWSDLNMLIEAVLLGAVIGWLRRGNNRQLADLNLPGWPLALLALAIQLAIMIDFNLGRSFLAPAAPYLHVISYAPLLGFVYLNRSHRGMILVGLGLLLNLIVIAANKGFMPVNS